MRIAITAAVALGLGAVMSFGDEGGKSEAWTAEGAARRLVGLAREDETVSVQAREEAMHALSKEYAAVSKAVVDVLNDVQVKPGMKLQYGSRAYYAVQVARMWRIVGAKSKLMDMVTVPVDPGSVPPGIMMLGSSYYPAAEALAALGGHGESTVGALTVENRPQVLWVLTEVFGKSGAIALLGSCREAGRFDAALLEKSIEIVKATERTSDLLPPAAR